MKTCEITFENEAQAKRFMAWLNNEGEQSFFDCEDLRCEEHPVGFFNYSSKENKAWGYESK